MTVQQLRARGLQVFVLHERPTREVFVPVKGRGKNLYRKERQVRSKGGLTTVTIIFPDGEIVEGRARCSRQDSFNKAIGRDIALGRAFKNYHMEVF